MRSGTLLAAFFLTIAAPGVVHADRGALTLELSPALTWWPDKGPSIGSGRGVNGTSGGGLIGLSLDDLKHIPKTIVVAAGVEKSTAILGALRSGAVTVLVTDDRTAGSVLALEGDERANGRNSDN